MGYSFYNKKKRKGFTLVELLVVIAILAVLAGVSVVGYLSFIKKAKVSNDISLTTQMNTILNANKAAYGKNDTPHDAVEDLIDGGLNVNKLTPTTNGYNYVYDLENDEMILLDEGMNLVAPEHKALRDSKISYFVFIENETELKSTNYNGYSFYLKNEFTSDNSLEVSTGIDVGENSILTIYYSNQNKQTALIRTNGGTLNVTAPEDTINHFGWIKELNITSVATSDCFHEHGYVGNLAKFESGKFTCYEGSEFHQTEEEIRNKLGDKGQDLPKGKYGEHHYDHGKCDIDDCSNPYDPKHEHTWSEWEIIQAATCTTGGTKEHKCTECGYTETETITALGHSWDDGLVTKEATCGETGVKTYTCQRTGCNETKTETIDALGHDYKYISKNNTYHTVICNRTDCNYSVEELHEFGSDNKCTKCEYIKNEEESTEVTITGVASWSTEADHKDDNGNTIGNTDYLSQYNVTEIDWTFFHTMTITYTIPAGTSANAKITLEQPEGISSHIMELAAPSQSFGITYKIINNSNNEYKISNTTFNSELIEKIVNTNTIIKLDDEKWICSLNDGTYKELSSIARPLITGGGPFEEYREWLKTNYKTTYTSVTKSFIEEYYNTHSITEGQKFMDFYETLPESSTDTSTTKANIWEKMCSSWAGDDIEDSSSDDYYRHVESEVIKQMILYQQKSLIGYSFVENKYDTSVNTSGWNAVYKKCSSSGTSAYNQWIGGPKFAAIETWDELDDTSFKVTSAVDLLKSENVSLVYNTNNNITTAGFALLWHGYAGNAWSSTEICDFPSLTITMEKV